jgi:sRNA-binding carbon storage regulator CsrA
MTEEDWLTCASAQTMLTWVKVRLTVVAVRGNQVRLGVTAPPGVPVRREELRRRALDRGPLPVRPEAGEAES